MTDQNLPTAEYGSGAGCFTRLYWMFLGPAALAIVLGLLLDKHPTFPSFLDAACLLIVASLVLVRHIDVRHFKGANGDSSAPATMEDWRKYSLRLVFGSVVAWLAVRLLAPLFAT